MYYFCFLTCFILIAYICGIQKTAPAKEWWFGREFTTCMKGFSILTVIWAHVGREFDVPGIQFIAGVGVTLFLICSGYGLEKSFQKNGLKLYWYKRFHTVYVPFLIVLVCVTIVDVIIKRELNLKDTIAALLLVKTNWYLGYIAVCYIAFYLIKYIVSKNEKLSDKETMLWIVCIVVSFIIYSIFIHSPKAPYLKARQVLSFPFGILLGKNKDQIEAFLRKQYLKLAIVCGGVGVFFMGVTQLHVVKALPYMISNFLSLFTCFPAAISVICIVTQYEKLLKNKFLYWVGIISYELFLIQYYTLRILENDWKSQLCFTVILVGGAIVLHNCKDKIIIKRKR